MSNLEEAYAAIRLVDGFQQRLMEMASAVDKYVELDKGCDYTQ